LTRADGSRPENDVEPAASAVAESNTNDPVAFWQARVDANREDHASRMQLASALLARGLARHNSADAIAADGEIDQVLVALPADKSAILIKAQARMFVHDFTAGGEYAERVLAQDATHKSALAIAGDAAFELGDLDGAERRYDALAARVPESPEVFARHARLAHARGATEEGIAFARQAIAAAEQQGYTPLDANYYHELTAEMLRGAGHYADANVEFEHVVAVNAKAGPAIEGLGKTAAALGDLNASETFWKRSGDLIGAPDFHVLAALGDIAAARGDQRTADKYWAEALDAVTALPEAARIGFLRDESRFRSTRGLDTSEALRLAKQDFEVRQDAYAYDTLAWAQLASGDERAALASIERALLPGVEDAGVWYHAAEIFAANDDAAHARDAVERALTISPQFDLFEAPRADALAQRLR
jgi:tetratricopeptide (TPR) repeat protein